MSNEGDGTTGNGTVSKKDTKAAVGYNLAYREKLEMEKEALNIAIERATAEGKYVEALQKQIELQGVKRAQIGEMALEMSKMADQADRLALANDLEEAAKAAGIVGEELLFLTTNLTSAAMRLGDWEKTLDDISASTKKMKSSTDEASRSVNNLENSIGGLVGGLNLGLTSSNGFASSMLRVGANLKVAEEKGVVFTKGMFAMAMAKQVLIGFANKLGNEIMSLAESSSKAAAEIAKLGGSTENTFYTVTQLSRGMLGLGVSMEQMGKITGTLMNDTAMLGDEIENSEMGSVRLAAKLTTAGVSAGQLTDMINTLTVGFGMGFDESVKFYESIIVDSKLAGQSVADLSKNLQQASNRLLTSGTSAAEMKREFEGLNMVSRQLGTEISDILKLTNQFDKFADAAKIAGQLNAQYGLQLSMTKLQNMESQERLEYLRQSFLAQGIEVRNLSRSNKLFLQNVTGISDMNTMMKMLGTTRNQEKDSVGSLNELLSKQMDAFTKLKAAMAEMALVLEPLIWFVTWLTEALAWFFGGIAEGINNLRASQNTFAWLAGWTLSAIAMFGALAIATVALGGSLFTMAKVVPAAGAKIGAGMTSFATAAQGFFTVMNTANMIKLGAIVAIFAIGFGIAALGLSKLAEAMKGMSGEVATAFVISIGVMGLAMIGFALAMAYAAPILATALVGVMAFAVGFAIAGGAMAVVLNSAAGLAQELGNMAEGSFGTLVDGLVTLTQMRSPLADLKADLESLNSLANNIDGMVIMQSTGESRTVMMASENIIKGKTEGSLDVNVKITMDDKINVANQVKVYLDSKELTDAVVRNIDEGA